MAVTSWKIHKFGGSSLKDAACFARVADILQEQKHNRLGVVVSAMGGMTDQLLRLAMLAERDNNAYQAELHEIGDQKRSSWVVAWVSFRQVTVWVPLTVLSAGINSTSMT